MLAKTNIRKFYFKNNNKTRIPVILCLAKIITMGIKFNGQSYNER